MLADDIGHGRSADEDLTVRDAASALLRQESLCDHRLQRERELHAHLRLLVRGEHVDDAVDRGRGVVRVQGREAEMARLGGGDRELDRFQITQFAY